MGRKRTSKKKRITVSVDEDIYERLKVLEINRSLMFTDAALELLKNSKDVKKYQIKE